MPRFTLLLGRSQYARNLTAHRDFVLQEQARSPQGPRLADAEPLLWLRLQHRQLGVRFVRLLHFGPYVADFAAPSRRLVLEVGGLYHPHRLPAEAQERAFLHHSGWRLLRLTHHSILKDINKVVRRIQVAVSR